MNDEAFEITLHHLSEVDSTNTYVKNHYAELPDGALVYADIQTAGRGRLNRSWLSLPGNFFGTLLLKRLDNPFLGTMVVSLAALDVLNKQVPELDVWLKWPNDLYVNECKLAGILSEAGVQANGQRFAAVGIGVNLALSEHELAAIDKPAASVGKDKINPEKFAFELAKCAKMYYIMGMYCSENLFALWRERNALVGMELVLELGNSQSVRGTACGIAGDGALIMRTPDGREKPYYCGDVSVSRESVKAAWERKKTLL